MDNKFKETLYFITKVCKSRKHCNECPCYFICMAIPVDWTDEEIEGLHNKYTEIQVN